MAIVYPDQFLGLPPCTVEDADAVILPLPFERTASYGTGAWRAPRAILDASCQVETFDEETLVDFEVSPRIHTAPAILDDGDAAVEEYLERVKEAVARLRGKFVLSLGGEHTVTYGLVRGLASNVANLTIVQVDAHADLRDVLDGKRWSHATVMRRLFEEGARLVQVGVRSVSREEYDLVKREKRIACFFAHELKSGWEQLRETLRRLRGDVYLSIDVDGLDPGVLPNTGTPQPDGLSWARVMEITHELSVSRLCRFLAADVVEYVASPHPPGCDIIAAKLVTKILAHRFAKR
ncbi:MAG: agmatinase [bacterium]|nr:agmatinase [bacterium]